MHSDVDTNTRVRRKRDDRGQEYASDLWIVRHTLAGLLVASLSVRVVSYIIVGIIKENGRIDSKFSRISHFDVII